MRATRWLRWEPRPRPTKDTANISVQIICWEIAWNQHKDDGHAIGGSAKTLRRGRSWGWLLLTMRIGSGWRDGLILCSGGQRRDWMRLAAGEKPVELRGSGSTMRSGRKILQQTEIFVAITWLRIKSTARSTLENGQFFAFKSHFKILSQNQLYFKFIST